MAHVAFPQHAKLTTLPCGRTYSYVLIPAKEDKSSILFLHGFPSSSFDWRHQIEYFSKHGYGIVAPDLLGYGRTSKPLEPAAYGWKRVACELVELLDVEGLSKVHGVGHDFGSSWLGRLYSYFPEKLISCAFLSVPYTPPGSDFDIDIYKDMSEQYLGFEKYGYMRFLSTDDSWKQIAAHHNSFTTIVYGEPAATNMRFYPPGALSSSLKADVTVPLPAWFTAEEKATRDAIFAAPDAYQAPTNVYRVLLGNLAVEEERKDEKSPDIAVPVLSILERKGEATVESFEQATAMYAKAGFRCVRVKGGDGHWVQLQCRDEVNVLLEEHFAETTAVGTKAGHPD